MAFDSELLGRTISWKGANKAPSKDVAEMIEIDNRPNVITDLSQ